MRLSHYFQTFRQNSLFNITHGFQRIAGGSGNVFRDPEDEEIQHLSLR
jgi:hypothetical protein